MKRIKLGWIATHPIQYQAPLLRAISQSGNIDLEVIFFSDFSVNNYHDTEFGKSVSWGKEILEGYKFQFLRRLGFRINKISTFSPVILNLRSTILKGGYDVVMIQGWNHYGMLMAAWICKRHGIKVLMRCEATDHIQSSKGLKKWIKEIMIVHYFSKIDFFFAIGTKNREYYKKRGIKKDKIDFMPYCVDNIFFEKKSFQISESNNHIYTQLDKSIPVILFSGKLISRKRPDLLLQAYDKLNNGKPYLIFVGDGELRNSLEAIAKEKKLDKVFFIGFQQQSELINLYKLANIFVLPSDDETWGLVVNEAMVCECAVIASDRVGSAVDLVRNNENGFIFKSGCVDSLVLALNKCLDNNSYHKMGKVSKKIIDNWGIPQNVISLNRVLKFIK